MVLQVNRVWGRSWGPCMMLGNVQARLGKEEPLVEWERKCGQHIRSIQSIVSLVSQNWPAAKPRSCWTLCWLSLCKDADMPRNVMWVSTWEQSSANHRKSFLKVYPHLSTKWTSSITIKANLWQNLFNCRRCVMGTIWIISGPIPITSHLPSSTSLHILWPSAVVWLKILELMAIKQTPLLCAFPS